MTASAELDLAAVRDLAVSLARGAGELARRAKGEGWDNDPPVEVDVERRLVHGITGRFRDHAVVSRLRRSGPDDARVVWVVDPLDAETNYDIGLEVYGVSIAVLVEGRTEVGIVHDSVSGRTCSAVRGEGAWREGQRLVVRDPRPVSEGVVAWLGWPDARDSWLEDEGAHVVRTGSPACDWGLLAGGGIDAVVGSGPVWSVAAGLLVATEAGARFEQHEDLLAVGTATATAEVVALVEARQR